MGNFLGTTNRLPIYRKIRVGESWMPRTRDENPLFQFLDEDSSDVLIFVKNSPRGEDHLTWSRYPCHRALLRQHIPELERTIRQESVRFPSEQDPEVIIEVSRSVIYIDEHKPEIVEDVLRYIYERYIRFEDWKNARDVLIMAKKYKMENLCMECEKFLIGSIRLRNACYLLQLSFECEQINLQTACLEFCSDTAFIVLKTKGFYEASQGIVQKLTERDDINIENELALFNALWEWSKTKCIQEQKPLTVNGITETLAECVANCVRFEMMDDKQESALPERVKEKFRQRLDERSEKMGRCLKFFEFYPISATLVFDCKPLELRDYRIGDKVTCMRFSLNVDSYLLEISTMCEIKATVAHIRRLKVVGEIADEFVFDSSRPNDTSFLNLGAKELKLEDSVVTITQFSPVDMLLLHAGTYSIDIEPQNGNIRWPLTDAAMNRKYSDVVVNLHGETCGLAKVELLQAY